MANVIRSLFPAVALLMALGACSAGGNNPGGGQAAQNAGKPGWTGRTFVPGSNSTVAGDAVATEDQQKWPLGRSH